MMPMVQRSFWQGSILAAWRKRPIVWLSGVRRVGKTVLARMVPDAIYLNCDLASVVRRLEDPETAYASLPPSAIVVFDEVHRLPDPSGVLKIGADAFPGLRILATGPSTLAATSKFCDSLTGRKTSLYLPPVLWTECRGAFDLADLDRRLLHGGLPEPLLSETKDPAFFAEWMDSYYARDISELFGVRNRTGFLALLRLLLNQSGGLLDIAKLASECGMSRHTVAAHIDAMTIAHAVFPVTPFHGGGRREIVRTPKLYAFDTGFVTFARGWDSLRDEDRGVLWEHLALDTIRAAGQGDSVRFWRDRAGREVDFVVPTGRDTVDAVECQVSPDRFRPDHLREFRAAYPHGRNWLVCPYEGEPWTRRWGELAVTVVSTQGLADGLGADRRQG